MSRPAYLQGLEESACVESNKVYLPPFAITAGWSSLVARQAHNLKVLGSNPSPATNLKSRNEFSGSFALYPVFLGI